MYHSAWKLENGKSLKRIEFNKILKYWNTVLKYSPSVLSAAPKISLDIVTINLVTSPHWLMTSCLTAFHHIPHMHPCSLLSDSPNWIDNPSIRSRPEFQLPAGKYRLYRHLATKPCMFCLLYWVLTATCRFLLFDIFFWGVEQKL